MSNYYDKRAVSQLGKAILKRMNRYNVKNIKCITKNKEFEVIPKEIIFKNIQLNYTYEVPVMIRNFLKKPKRIRIFQPQKYPNVFKCHYKNIQNKAVGMAMKFKVTFEAEELMDYEDKF